METTKEERDDWRSDLVIVDEDHRSHVAPSDIGSSRPVSDLLRLLADADRSAELEAEVEQLRAGMEKLLAVVEAVEEHRLHLGPVGKDLDGERAPGGFIYVAGCWCKSCTAEAYRRMPDQARTGER